MQYFLDDTPEDIERKMSNPNFFTRYKLFFGDTMESYDCITIEDRRYMYRKPDVLVTDVNGKRVVAGRKYFSAWAWSGDMPELITGKDVEKIYAAVMKQSIDNR